MLYDPEVNGCYNKEKNNCNNNYMLFYQGDLISVKVLLSI